MMKTENPFLEIPAGNQKESEAESILAGLYLEHDERTGPTPKKQGEGLLRYHAAEHALE